MKFPCGIRHFETGVTEGDFYRDRTGRIPVAEEAGKNLLFLRPRRFGKTRGFPRSAIIAISL